MIQYSGRPAASTRYDNLTDEEFIRELERLDIDPALRESIIFRLRQLANAVIATHEWINDALVARGM